MTDHEIHVKLARFMGFEELPSAGRPAFSHACRRCERSGLRAFLQDGDRLGMLGGGFWEPLVNPGQAVEVMIQASKRWTVDAGASSKGAWAMVTERDHPFLRLGAEQRSVRYRPEESPSERWCRAVCLAVLAAIEVAA